ncbi:hypothetical protein PO124_14695 [Bacillus licheniformis]|nr:hypothetical protein [Bacillus licheniformis]
MNIPKKALVAIMGVIGIIIALLGVQICLCHFNILRLVCSADCGSHDRRSLDHSTCHQEKQYQFGAGTTYSKLNVAAILSVIIGGLPLQR